MKKLITILLCMTCISANAVAQSDVRIGNVEISFKKNADDNGTMVNIYTVDPYSSEDETHVKSKKSRHKYHKSSFFTGLGFALPDNGSDYYTVLGVNSMNIDAGWMHRYQITRRFALGSTLQYSYYNYKLRDAASEPAFMEEVLGNKIFAENDINKQVFRSHNIAAGVFTRFHLTPPPRRGIFIDLGVQGDFAFSKYYIIKMYQPKGKGKYRDGYAFNPFTASAIARMGWKSYAIFARYRFTEVFNSKALPMELPPITIGIQFL